MAESEEGLNCLLMRVKEESEKAGLKVNIWKTKIMATASITSWQIEGGKWKQWQFLFLGSKITVEDDCSHEIKRWWLLGGESYDKPKQHSPLTETSLYQQRSV